MQITFLGTSSMAPTKERGHTGIYIDCGKEKILFDCGENMQRQLRCAGIAVPRITRIFISHWHGDHVFGLPGILENIAANSAEKYVRIYGTKEVQQRLEAMMKAFGIFGKLAVDFTVIKKNGKFAETADLVFHACFLKHSTPTLGYAIHLKDTTCIDKKKLKQSQLPPGPFLKPLQLGKNIKYKGKTYKAKDLTYVKQGKKLAITIDTLPCPSIVTLAKKADMFICESTFMDNAKAIAKSHWHMTSTQAGQLAKKAQVQTLVLTHFSQRYKKKDVQQMKQEAGTWFTGPIKVADDFTTITI